MKNKSSEINRKVQSLDHFTLQNLSVLLSASHHRTPSQAHLRDADLTTRLQEVLHVASAFRHRQFGLKGNIKLL